MYSRQVELDSDLLATAMRAEERLIATEHEVELARADFHRAIRRLHLSGASHREIAVTLGYSHQRVHQIVEDAGGGRRWRKRRDRGETQACSFCGRPRRATRQLVAGPGVFICERCVGLATDLLSTGESAKTPLGPLSALSPAEGRERCSFCGKRGHEIAGLASTGAVHICAECLVLCAEILAERLA